MDESKKIMITGAAGFIGSVMASFLNKLGYHQLILVDDFTIPRKQRNFSSLSNMLLLDRNLLKQYFDDNPTIDCIIHFGARTDTTEMNYAIHEALNLNYSKMVWQYCTLHQIPLIYASSAATYGHGELGYLDQHDLVNQLQPLNPYGVSKNEFDKWALQQPNTPPFWYGLKFFNVYGPNEYHKGRMASVIFHAYHQIVNTDKMVLFKSHHPDYRDGEQQRDFIYVMDVVKVTFWLMKGLAENGLYNLGTGKAETFLNLAYAVFLALNKTPQIEFIDTPEDIREKYQYFTEANMQKLKQAGYTEDFFSLKNGVGDYILNYLGKDLIY